MSITFENMSVTENGAFAYNSTGSECLNLFARIGGMRDASEKELIKLFLAARAENETIADNVVLYARDVRNGGLGERKIGRTLIKELAKLNPEKVKRNFDTIVSAGRWDDLFVLEGTSLETAAFDFVITQLKKDIKDAQNGKPISLLAKWMPSINTSSSETRRLARKLCNHMGVSERLYRKTLSKLRKHIDVVEVKMSANAFDAINYEAVPSNAMTLYRSAFGRHDYERFDAYLKAVKGGTAKINSSVTYPYELIRPYTHTYRPTMDPVLEAQWKALPNYVEGEHNVIVMSDVSGSMNGTPMDVSVSLGIYFAERNTGAYKNLLVSFTDVPTMYELNPKASLASRAKEVMSHEGYNTNLDGALKAIYNHAKECGVAPEALVVISDGEIDWFMARMRMDGLEDLVERWQRKYAEIGLVAPKLIMWNVASRTNTYLSTKANLGISFVSGSSASTFKELTNLINYDAVTAMVNILSKPCFQWK